MFIFVKESKVMCVVNDEGLAFLMRDLLNRPDDPQMIEIPGDATISDDNKLKAWRAGECIYSVRIDFATGTIKSVWEIEHAEAIRNGYLIQPYCDALNKYVVAAPKHCMASMEFRTIVFAPDRATAQKYARAIFISSLREHATSLEKEYENAPCDDDDDENDLPF